MEDRALIERFLSGDEEGFTILVKKYQDRVVNIVYSLTGRVDDADDIAQEVFMRVYRGLAAFKKKAEFSTWLHRITVNATYNYLKSKRRHTLPEEMPAVEAVQNDGLDSLAAQERQGLIKRALERLPFKLRTAIVLKEVQGLSYKDIAKALGCRIGTVESRLFRARQMLKKLLAPLLKAEARDEVRQDKQAVEPLYR